MFYFLSWTFLISTKAIIPKSCKCVNGERDFLLKYARCQTSSKRNFFYTTHHINSNSPNHLSCQVAVLAFCNSWHRWNTDIFSTGWYVHIKRIFLTIIHMFNTFNKRLRRIWHQRGIKRKSTRKFIMYISHNSHWLYTFS